MEEEEEGIWIDKEREIGKVRAFGGEEGVLRDRGGPDKGGLDGRSRMPSAMTRKSLSCTHLPAVTLRNWLISGGSALITGS